jgi:hypothetical protein
VSAFITLGIYVFLILLVSYVAVQIVSRLR